MTRIPFQTRMRGAAVTLLESFKVNSGIGFQIYRARPRSINPPTAYVENVREAIVFDGMRQRTVQVEVRFLWGKFDDGDSVDQRDAAIDAFVDWVTDRRDAADANSDLQPRSIEDDPTFIADWLKPEDQRTLFSSLLTLEGFAAGG